MLASTEYSSYTNVTTGMGFLSAISEHLRESLLSKVKLSPCYSILIDESIDRTCEPHLIVYLCYLSKGGEGALCIKFIELMPLSRGTGEVIELYIKSLPKLQFLYSKRKVSTKLIYAP